MYITHSFRWKITNSSIRTPYQQNLKLLKISNIGHFFQTLIQFLIRNSVSNGFSRKGGSAWNKAYDCPKGVTFGKAIGESNTSQKKNLKGLTFLSWRMWNISEFCYVGKQRSSNFPFYYRNLCFKSSLKL